MKVEGRFCRSVVVACRDDILLILRTSPVASISQLAALAHTSEQMARRWVRELSRTGKVSTRPGVAGRGRPQQLVCLANYRGNALSHEWLVTEFVVQLANLCAGGPDLAMQLLNAVNCDGLVPDLGFLLTSAALGKTLLFFVEVDRATEPGRRRGIGADIDSKISRYRALRITGKYLDVVPAGTEVRGFRVLVSTPSAKRRTEICNLADQAKSDFVWSAQWSDITTLGLGGRIWAHCAQPSTPSSILGSLARAAG